MRLGGLIDERGIEIAPCICGEVRFEVVRDLVLTLHAQEGFSIARVSAALLERRTLENRDAHAALARRDCGG